MKSIISKVVISILLFVVLAGIVVASKCVAVYNTSIEFTTAIEAKQKDNQSVFDGMWKKISQTAQVSDKYKDGLKEVLEVYVSGRSVDGDSLLVNWTKEAVPQFDSSIYKEINNTIIAGRDDFIKHQRILLDQSREFKKFMRTFPNNIFCSILGIKDVDIKIVTSSKTENTFETQKEEDINI